MDTKGQQILWALQILESATEDDIEKVISTHSPTVYKFEKRLTHISQCIRRKSSPYTQDNVSLRPNTTHDTTVSP